MVAFVRISPLTYRLDTIAHCDLCGELCARAGGTVYRAESRADVNRISMRADLIGALPPIRACDALRGAEVCPVCFFGRASRVVYCFGPAKR